MNIIVGFNISRVAKEKLAIKNLSKNDRSSNKMKESRRSDNIDAMLQSNTMSTLMYETNQTQDQPSSMRKYLTKKVDTLRNKTKDNYINYGKEKSS